MPKAGPACPHKVCGVCGDRALGYNFNAVTCESCKAFFRRNAITNKEFRCPFTNSCEINVVTRRFCQKCRLDKCFDIGMVKEYIMTTEDKAEKRKKIEENRAKKRKKVSLRDGGEDVVTSSKLMKLEDESKSPPTTYVNSPPVIETNSVIQYDVLSTTCSPNGTINSPLSNEHSPYPPYENPEYDHYQQVYDQKHRSDYQTDPSRPPPRYDSYSSRPDEQHQPKYRQESTIKGILTSQGKNIVQNENEQRECDEEPSTSSRDSYSKARDILEDVERIPIEPNSIESILCEAIKLEFEAYSTVPHANSSSRELNEVERAKLNELIVANKALHAPIDMDISMLFGGVSDFKDSKHDPTLLSIINLTAVAIRRLIKMSKKINAFKNMCEEDQVALLKGGCTEMMMLRSTITYDCTKNSWNIPHLQEELGSIKTDVLKLAKGNIYHAHENFIRTFDPRWRTDENIILIMSAICLFTPDRPKVVHRDVIKLEQNSYYYLLRRYLESTYAGCEAKSIFLKLIQKIMELHRLTEEVIGVYLDVNPIEPLLMEIFDLKQHAT